MRSSILLLPVVVACVGEERLPAPDPTRGVGAVTATEVPLPTSCPSPVEVLAANGGSLARPGRSALRFTLVFQGEAVGVDRLHGVDMRLPPSDGPLAEGSSSGHWAELRDAAGAPLYTAAFRDPTIREVPPPPGGGDFSNVIRDRCEPTPVVVDVPNAQGATELVVFGSPPATGEAAGELARFTIR